MPAPSPRFVFHVLGPPRVSMTENGARIDVPLGKPLAALAYVALEPSRVTREDLAALLWPATPPERARASVRQAIWLLRKLIDPGILLEDEDSGLRLDPAVIDHDLDTWRSLLAQGDVEQAWERWHGGPLRGLAVSDAPGWQHWADERRAQGERELGEALEAAAERERGERRLLWLERAREVRPFREAVHVALVRTLIDLGREEPAGEALRRLRGVVDEPDPTLLDRLDEDLRQLRRSAIEQPPDRLVPDFVGRSEEFSRLSGLWETARGGRRRSVGLVGPTGIGKSRLAAELLRRARAEGAVVAEAKALDVERALDLGLAGALVRELLALPGAAGISIGSSEALETLVPSRRRSGGAPAQVPPPALADALVDLLEAVSQEAALILLVEDVHWADTPSRALLLRAVRGLRRARVLMLWTSRSDTEDASALRTLRAAEAGGSATLIDLRPLSRAEVTEMLALLVTSRGPAVEVLAGRIHEASAGNPLHAVELLQALRARGVLTFEPPTGWLLHEDRIPDSLELPLSVRQALEQRLSLLSDEARALAAILARRPEPMTLQSLLEASGAEGSWAARALGELLQRDVVRWTRDDQLTFSHDSIRETVRSAVTTPSALRRPLVAWAIGIAAVALLVLGWWASSTATSGADEVMPPPELRGALWLGTQDMLYRLGVEGEEWVVADSLGLPPGAASLRPYRTGDGSPATYASLSSVLRGPDIVRVTRQGVDTIYDGGGDDGAVALAPDGRHLLFASEDTAHASWLVELRVMELATGRTWLIHRPSHRTWGAAWLPDGGRIAVAVSEPAQPDSVLLYDPTGRRVGGMASPVSPTHALVGCGSGWLVSALPPGEPAQTWFMTPEGDARRMQDAGFNASSRMACSPDGSVVVSRSGEGGGGLQVTDLTSRESRPLPAPRFANAQSVLWTPASFAVLPARVDILPDTLRVAWGGEIDVPFRVTLSDGSTGNGAAALRTVDERVAVARVGRVLGNAPGQTAVIAEIGGWIADTVPVRVEGEVPEEAMWVDRFDAIDTASWHPIGYPTAEAVTEAGAPVLAMLGDGVWSDGLYSERVVDLSGGATVELEFRLPLSRRDRQSIHLCLTDSDPPPNPDRAPGWNTSSGRRHVCAVHPADELSRFDSTTVELRMPAEPVGPLSFPDDLPARDWTHLAIQVRSDGAATLVLNRRARFTLPFPLRIEPDRPWRILLTGRAVETDLRVRNLVVWRGERYEE